MKCPKCQTENPEDTKLWPHEAPSLLERARIDYSDAAVNSLLLNRRQKDGIASVAEQLMDKRIDKVEKEEVVQIWQQGF